MKKTLLYAILFLCLTQITHSQENGVVALDLPIRNSLKFNRYVVNPTFSFVREQNKYISFSNKKQWVQFEDAPQAYLFSLSGRFKENIGAGIGLFQQNYGVQTTFGGILNFAYNAVLNRDNNLTFGLNIGAYQSGINEGGVITNFPDPTLQNIPKHFLLTVNPGINFGTAFFDFGLSYNNLVSYSLKNSKIIEDNPEQSLQAHVMYSGYMDSRGFFDESKFSALLRSEFKKEKTVISGLAMLTIPKGIWGQIGYNTLYGASAGAGINISEQIAIEYNYEQSVGDLSGFGNSHEFTVAYRFKTNNRYLYSGDDDEKSVFATKKRKRTIAKRRSGSTKPRTTRPASRENKTEEANVTSEQKETQDAIASTVNDNEQNVLEENTNTQEEQISVEEEASREQEQEQEQAEVEAKRIKAEEEAKALAEKALKEKQRAEAEALKKKEEAEARAREEAVRKQQALEAKVKEEARIKAEAEKARIEAARVKAEQEALLKAQAEEEAKVEEEKRKADEAARLEEEAKLEEAAQEAPVTNQEAQQVENQPELDEETSNSIKDLNESAEVAKEAQESLITRLTEKVAVKQKDLDDLKEENDLSEQGIYVEPKPFKSVSAENAEIENLKDELDKVIEEQRIKIEQLETVYIIRKRKVRDDRDPLNAAYLRTIEQLKAEQLKTIQAKADLEASLETIKIATEEERKRRIKRAAYDNQQDRFKKDSASLAFIKKFTDPSPKKLTEDDFDFGDEQSNNIQIVKNVSHADNGYYMVIAVHNNEAKRDEFLKKVVSTGRKDVNFFFDVNSNKYYIYYDKFDNIGQAQSVLETKDGEPYNAKMSIVKIEN